MNAFLNIIKIPILFLTFPFLFHAEHSHVVCLTGVSISFFHWSFLITVLTLSEYEAITSHFLNCLHLARHDL